MNLRTTAGVAPAISGWLDLARGLAAVEVLAFHNYQLLFGGRVLSEGASPELGFAYSVLQSLSGHGVAAVVIFFVLSGYLVGGPALVRALHGRLSATDYFTARAARMYTVLIPALLLSVILYAMAQTSGGWDSFVASHQHVYNSRLIFTAPIGPLAALCNGLFLQTIACREYAGNLALWSLANEVWYYVLFFALLSLRKNLWWALPIIGIFGLFYLAEQFDTAGTHTGEKFVYFFAIWCFGVVAYAVVAPFWLWGCGLAVGLAGLYLLALNAVFVPWVTQYAAIGLVTCGLIVALEHLKTPLPIYLRFWAAPLAKFSFSLYAIHYPILLVLNTIVASQISGDFTWKDLALYAHFAVVSIFAAWMFYLIFEDHTHEVRLWLLSSSEPSAPCRQVGDEALKD